MRESRKQGRIVFMPVVMCVIALLISSCAEAASYGLKLRQFCADMPSATAYFDLYDAKGNIIKPSEDITLNVAGKQIAPKSLSQFSHKDDGVAVVVALDVSASVSQKRFAELKNALSIWMKQLSPKDRVAVVSFGDDVSICQDYTGETKTLLYTVQNLKAKDANTRLNSAVIKSLELAGIKNASLPERRMVILASDCMDDSSSSATQNEVMDAISETHIPIYTMLFDAAKKSPQVKTVNSIGEYARRSGGNFYDVKSKPFVETLKRIFKDIEKTNVAQFNLEGIAADGQKQRVSLVYSHGDLKLSEGIDVRLIGEGATSGNSAVSADSAAADEGSAPNKSLIFGAVALIIIAAGAAAYVCAKNKKARSAAKPKEEKEVSHSKPAPKVYTPPTAPAESAKLPASVKGPALELELAFTNSRGTTEAYNIAVANRLTVGRKSANAAEFGIPGDDTISGKHCELIFSNGTLSVIDLNSTNGTFVNGVRTRGTYPLNNNDCLKIGKTEFKIKITGIR